MRSFVFLFVMGVLLAGNAFSQTMIEELEERGHSEINLDQISVGGRKFLALQTAYESREKTISRRADAICKVLEFDEAILSTTIEITQSTSVLVVRKGKVIETEKYAASTYEPLKVFDRIVCKKKKSVKR